MSKHTELGPAVIESLKFSTVTALAKEYAEAGIDAALSDGLFKDIPFVSTIIAIGKFGVRISDRLLIKKLMKFLEQFSHLSDQERMEMIQKPESDYEYRRIDIGKASMCPLSL